MVREIKFRAWDGEIMYYNIHKLYDGYGNITDRDGNELDIYKCKKCNVRSFGDWLDDEDYNVMQYTGLKDRNGKEIYEGDIIQSTWDGRRHEVAWHDGEWKWFDNCDSNLGKENYRYAGTEIIGNIYENPEIIKN